MVTLVSWLTATTRTGTPANSWRTILLWRKAYMVTSAGSRPQFVTTRANNGPWSVLFQDVPFGLVISSEAAGRSTDANRAASPAGIGTGYRDLGFGPLPLRASGIIVHGPGPPRRSSPSTRPTSPP